MRFFSITFYKIKLHIEILRMKRKYPDLYIYGCGYYAFELEKMFDKWCILFDGFIVSKANDIELRGHRILEYTENFFDNDTVCIVFGLNRENTQEVMEYLGEKYEDRIITYYWKCKW